MLDSHPFGPGLHVFERGWLSSNNVLLDGAEHGATLIDSGHCVHAEQTVALVRQRLAGRPLASVVNTHLHSDHCGGNAALQREWGCPITVPSGSWLAVQRWDEQVLGYAPMRQRCERFQARASLHPGQMLRAGGRDWAALAAPGHDPESLMLFDAEHGVLISADALWENGFGLVFPELEGDPAFHDVEQVLDLIAGLAVRWVIPGHGAPFSDVPSAIARARARLAGYRADPARHLRHGAKVLLKYHLMEEQQCSLAALREWMHDVPYLALIWSALDRPEGTLPAWCDRLLQEQLSSGVLVQRDGLVCDR
jgi:glyoxylase-like metal-dependent hydrolase (beta-lactamase superfamily II)